MAEGVEMIMPGDNTEMEVELIAPIAMEEGLPSPSARAAAPWAPAEWSPSSSSGNRDDDMAAPKIRIKLRAYDHSVLDPAGATSWRT